jgi:hypothetical protein
MARPPAGPSARFPYMPPMTNPSGKCQKNAGVKQNDDDAKDASGSLENKQNKLSKPVATQEELENDISNQLRALNCRKTRENFLSLTEKKMAPLLNWGESISIIDRMRGVYSGNSWNTFANLQLKYNTLLATGLFRVTGLCTGREHIDRRIFVSDDPALFRKDINERDKAVIHTLTREFEKMADEDVDSKGLLEITRICWEATICCPYAISIDGTIISENGRPLKKNRQESPLNRKLWVEKLVALNRELHRDKDVKESDDMKKATDTIVVNPVECHDSLMLQLFKMKHSGAFQKTALRFLDQLGSADELENSTVRKLYDQFLLVSLGRNLFDLAQQTRQSHKGANKEKYLARISARRAVKRLPGTRGEIFRELRFMYSNPFAGFVRQNHALSQTSGQKLSVRDKVQINNMLVEFEIYLAKTGNDSPRRFLERSWALLKQSPYIVDPSGGYIEHDKNTFNRKFDLEKKDDKARMLKKRRWIESVIAFSLERESLLPPKYKYLLLKNPQTLIEGALGIAGKIPANPDKASKVQDVIRRHCDPDNFSGAQDAIRLHNEIMSLAEFLRLDVAKAAIAFSASAKMQAPHRMAKPQR